MLNLGRAHRFFGGSDAYVVPVKLGLDRVNCAWIPSQSRRLSRRDNQNRSGHLPRVDAIELPAPCADILRARDSHPRGSRANRVRLAKRNGRDSSWRERDGSRHQAIRRARHKTAQATAWLVQAQQSSSTGLLHSRLDVAELKFEIKRLWEFTSATETWIPVASRSPVRTLRYRLQMERLHDAV